MIRHDWTIYCDGSHKDGQTSGAWLLVNLGTGERIEGSEHFATGTVNTAELNAIIKALEAVPTPPNETRVIVYCDSEWSIKVITGEYKAKTNLNLIAEAVRLLSGFAAAGISHTPAHVGNAGNERVDRLAREARETVSQSFQPGVHVVMQVKPEGMGATFEVVGVGDSREQATADARADGHPAEGYRYQGSKIKSTGGSC